MGSIHRAADVLACSCSPFSRHRRAALPILLRSVGWLFSAIFISLVMMSHMPAVAADAQPNRIRIEYRPPKNPALQNVYDLAKQRHALERMQEVFSPFRLPSELMLIAQDCGGMSNAWYYPPAVNICYEYMNDILQSAPSEETPEGITRADAVIGQFAYVVAHEMGHAMFDILHVPILGGAEDAADHFSVYIMLQFGQEQARRLILGAAYSYNRYLQSPQVTAPLTAFSSAHSPPAQRFYNLICLAYGANATLFADFVDKGYLPRARAGRCNAEYEQVHFAFQTLIVPHLDQQMARQVLDMKWLPARPQKN